MGDQDQRHAVIFLKLHQQVEDLLLDRHVQRGRRLVRDQQAGLRGDGDGDHHPLALAAGQLVRIGLQLLLGRGDADGAEQLQRAGAGLASAEAEVQAQHLLDLEADREGRVQRGDGLLEDHGDLAPDQAAALGRGHRQQVAAVIGHLVGGDGGGVGQKAHHRQHRHGLARAGFAHDGQDLAPVHADVHAIDGGEAAGGGGEADGQVADVQDRHGVSSA